MNGFSATRVIPAPVTEVWRVFADPQARGRFGDVELVEPLTTGTSGELVPGQRWRETRTTASGAAVTEELVVVAVDQWHSVTLALAGASASGQLTYRFDPVPGGTAVTGPPSGTGTAWPTDCSASSSVGSPPGRPRVRSATSWTPWPRPAWWPWPPDHGTANADVTPEPTLG